MPTGSPTGFTQDAFDAFLAARDEPAWLIDLRRKAWQRFLELPMPSVRDEEWMRTDIRLFKLDRFSLPDPSTHRTQSRESAARAVGRGRRAGRADGERRQPLGARANSIRSWRSKGVLFGSLDALVAEHGDLLRPFFERRVVDPFKDKFSALQRGLLVAAARCSTCPRACASTSRCIRSRRSADGGVDLGKTLVILETGAEATLLSETASTIADGGGLHCGSIELIVEQGARLRYVNLQNWGHEVWHFAHQKAHVGREGRLQWTIGALGARLAKVNQHVAMTGPGRRSAGQRRDVHRRPAASVVQHASASHGRRIAGATCCTRRRCRTARAPCGAA